MTAGRVKRNTPSVAKRVGRPPLPRWPELHPRYHTPSRLKGLDKWAYELATKGEEATHQQ